MAGAIWDEEEAWTLARYSDLFVDFLKASLPPFRRADEDTCPLTTQLWRTPIVEVILSQQQPDGSWPLGGPPWFRVYPRPLLVLLEYGMAQHPAVRRGVAQLLSTLAGDRFVWPRREPYDPREYYVRHQGACLQVMAKAGLANDPRVLGVVRRLLNGQRWDGGWSTRPDWMYGDRAPAADLRPSCWICTLDVMRGLGQVGSVPGDLVDRLLAFWQANIEVEVDRLKSRLPHGLSVERLAGFEHADVAVLLAILEFCARTGLRTEDDRVRRFLALLDRSRGPDGRFHKFPDYVKIMRSHILGQLGATSSRS